MEFLCYIIYLICLCSVKLIQRLAVLLEIGELFHCNHCSVIWVTQCKNISECLVRFHCVLNNISNVLCDLLHCNVQCFHLEKCISRCVDNCFLLQRILQSLFGQGQADFAFICMHEHNGYFNSATNFKLISFALVDLLNIFKSQQTNGVSKELDNKSIFCFLR